ncbi:CHAT domain-containing protein [Suillus cothurnatus]|nr:CHAT domain-containing protein [Suillus cothurnatus]
MEIQMQHNLNPQTLLVALFSLSSALCSRFTHTLKNEDVEEAIDLCQKSLAILPSLHPERYYSYLWLTNAYLPRYQIQHNPADLSLAVKNFRLASGHPTQGFPHRIQTALHWVTAAESHQHDSALEAYQVCLELFDSHAMTRSSITSRREAATAFHSAHSLPVDAASCAIRRGSLRRAVELMEQGRGQQWSLASRLKTPVEDLESTNSKLAHNYLELSKRVSNAAQSSATVTDRAAADRAATEYRRLTRQWEAVVAEIRDIRAFSRFLLPPLYEDLQTAARQGPVIILIASQYSCSAIIIPTSGEPHHVPLSSVTLADLKTLKNRFTRAIRHASRMNPRESRTDLIVLLRTIWDEIMLPIVKVLEYVLELKHRSRIWLCPIAAFTSIPLHAANPCQTKADRSGKEPCLEDLYICSYTPTLSALVRSRQMTKKRVPPSFVAIGQGQPGAGKGKALLTVDSELELVHKLVPAMANRTTISGDAATRTGALEALEKNTWVHLACHGKQDPTQPYNSHFVMRDEHLTLLDIMEKDIPHAEFAFLSACHTAVGDEKTPDEVIHLAAGLQFSGFKSVIGTLWEVDDGVAKHIVEAFYKYMFMDLKDGAGVVMDCSKAAWALNCATHSVKTKVPLEQRIIFIHIGIIRAQVFEDLPGSMAEYYQPAPVVQAIRAVASASSVGSDGLQGTTTIAIAIVVVILVLVGLGITYHWWRPAIPIHSFYSWMPCFVVVPLEERRHSEEHGNRGTPDIPPAHTVCNRSWERYSECTVSCWPMDTMSDMASISFGDHPSEPAAASSVPPLPAATTPPAATNGAKSRASSVRPKDSDSDSFWCPEASDIEHCSECNPCSASFLEMSDTGPSERTHTA